MKSPFMQYKFNKFYMSSTKSDNFKVVRQHDRQFRKDPHVLTTEHYSLYSQCRLSVILIGRRILQDMLYRKWHQQGSTTISKDNSITSPLLMSCSKKNWIPHRYTMYIPCTIDEKIKLWN